MVSTSHSQQQYYYKAIIDSAAMANKITANDSMRYKILRLEKTKSREGNDEIFVDVNIYDDLGVTPFGHWLTEAEMAMYLKDNNAINKIVESYLFQERKAKLEDIKASKNIKSGIKDRIK